MTFRAALAAVAFASATSCATTGVSTTGALPVAAHATAAAPVATGPAIPADLHGEPLALLPTGPAMWARVDVARARTSGHWPTLIALLHREASTELRDMERDLGFDPLATAEMLALGLYVAPGATVSTEHAVWPLIYVRARVDRAAILAAARTNARTDDPLTERSSGAFRYVSNRQRAYAFPADDVVLMFDPALLHRVMAQLDGTARSSVVTDARFERLWHEIGGAQGAVRVAADLASMRATRAVSETAQDPSAALTQAVAWGDVPGELNLRIAGLSGTDEGAARVVSAVDEVRHDLLGRWEIRLLGLGRLFQQGVTAVHEGRVLRVQVHADDSEVRRVTTIVNILRAVSL